MSRVRELVRSWRGTRVDFIHVPQEENVLADWAGGVALRLEEDVDVVRLVPDLREGMSAPIDTA